MAREGSHSGRTSGRRDQEGAQSRGLLLVDGYNVIRRVRALSEVFERDPATARDRLVDMVASYSADAKEAVVVFDGSAEVGMQRADEPADVVRVVFSSGQDADSVIEAMAHEARRAGRTVTVVTSDSAIRDVVLGERVTYVRAEDMVDSIREHTEGTTGPRFRATVEDMLPEGVADRLRRLREGD